MLSDDFLPLRADIATWDDVPLYPADVFGAPDDALLDRLYWTGFEFIEGETTLSAELAIGWEGVEEIAFPLMGSQGISLMLGGGDSTSVAFSTTFADDGLQVAVTSRIGLRFGMDLIRPVTLQNGEYIALDDAIYEVAFEDATVTLSTSGDLTFENLDTLDFAPFAIGETGLVVAPGAVTLCFSADVAESLMVAHPDAGLNAGFRGVFIADGSVHFPETFPIESVTIRNAFIGNLGFTGALQANIGDPDAGVVGRNACMGFPFALRSVSLSFVQNALTGFAIEGDLTIPFFDKTVGVALGLGVDGALTIGLSDPNGLANLTLEQIGTLKVTGFAIIIDGIDVGLMLSGSLLLSVAGLQWPEIGVQELLIRPDGTVSVSGGWLKLQAPLAVDLFGFRLEISQIGFGKEDDGRSWIGFSGGLHLIDLLPTGASVEGMRILWQPGANLTPQITLQGVGIALAVPGALEFTGDVTMVNEADDHYFAGSAELVLTPLGITLDAVVKIGHNADLDFNYVYIFLSLQLPVGIPLWASGTALYGIAGLLGVNVEPDTTGGDWYGWYAGPPQFNITDDSKWRGALDSMAFGAGITLGTVFDTGFTISTKALVALLLPGPVILFNGKANFLQLPPGLLDNSEGSLNMLAVLDARAGTFLFTIDAGWELPQVVDVQASAEAYFDFARPENWHVYLGQDQPDERRIRANVLALFNADAYLMIDHQGIAAGFGVDFGDEWRFGPVQVALKSWIASGAAITWTPAQLEGQLGLGGEFSIGVAGFSAGISAEASLSGKAPKPYWIRGDLTVRLNLPAPIKDLEENILLEWKQDLPPGLQDPFSSISLEHLKVSETWTPRLSGTDSEPTDAGYDAGPVVPLDARPLLVFDRAVLDNSGLNNVNAQYGGSTAIGDYTFDYTLDPDSIRLEKWPKAGAGGWTAFDSADLDGAWAVEVDGEGKASASKLQIMAKTPFAFTRRTSRTYADWFLAAYPGWPCGEAVAATERCVDWHGVEFQDVSGTAFVHEDLTFLSEFAMWLDGGQFMPACPDPAGRALHFSYTLWILFPEPVRRVELCLKGAFDAVRGWAASEVLQEIARPAEGRVVLEASGMTWVEVAARVDDAWLGPICYTTEAESAAADQEIRNLERIEANVLHWSSADVLLPPNTYFRLAVTSRATRKRDGVADDEDTYTHYAYFHTDGPPALRPAWAEVPAPDTSGAALSVESYPTGGKLTDLSGYVARCIPAHGQAAVYRAYGMGVEFNENYVQQMYGADMVIRLRDANDQPVVDADGNEVEFLNVWEELPSTSLSITEIPYVTRVQDCVPLSVAGIAPDETLISTCGVRFEETFDGALDNWTDPNAPDGDPNTAWTIAGGMVSLSGAILSPLGALLVAGDAAWTDYAVEAELTETGEEVGLVFRYAGGDTATYYRLRLNAAGRTLERISGGDVLALWQDTTPYTPSADQILAVQCFGARIRGQLGMELLFDLSDADALPAGQIGLYTNATAAFAHVLVRDWPGAALAAETLYRAELAGSYVLFQADGWPDDPAAAGWLDLADEDNANQRIVFIGQAEWTDYRLEATLTPVDGAPLGLLVRAQLDGDTFRAYRLYWSAADDSIRFALVSGALDLAGKTYTITERNLLRECRGVACEVDFGLTEHDVSIVCHGAQFSISVDGVQIASVTDGALSGGLIGLYYGGSASAPTGFAEILARSEPRGAVYDWQFVTSAYAGFVEHIDTFAGVVYDDAPGRPDGAAAAAQIVSAAAAIATANAAVLDARGNLASADALTMTQRLGEAQAALAARQQTASDEFEAIFALFVGETYRRLPPVVELTALRGTDGVYALLLDSPEPLDWDRIAVQVKRRGADGQYHDVTASGFFTWNADGTRALFMNAGGAALQGGDFALHLAYQLDIGAEAPVLRRNGSTLPEIAALSFSL